PRWPTIWASTRWTRMTRTPTWTTMRRSTPTTGCWPSSTRRTGIGDGLRRHRVDLALAPRREAEDPGQRQQHQTGQLVAPGELEDRRDAQQGQRRTGDQQRDARHAGSPASLAEP